MDVGDYIYTLAPGHIEMGNGFEIRFKGWEGSENKFS